MVRNKIPEGTITYELIASKYIKRQRGWHTIDTILVDETKDLDEVIKKVKIAPTKIKEMMAKEEKEYFNKLKNKK
jgi:hypothetical protein